MKIRGFFHEFKEFAVKGNVVDLAVGIIIGGAFNKIVTSLVSGILLPPIGLLLNRVDFSNLYVSLNGEKYASLSAAQQAGAPVLMYGDFINSIITFTITAFAVFLLVKQINAIRNRRAQSKEAPSPTTKHCEFCFSEIPLQATRCPNCTSELKAQKATA